MCMLLDEEKECTQHRYIPLGSTIFLGLMYDQEAQSRYLVTKIANVERQHPIAPVPGKFCI